MRRHSLRLLAPALACALAACQGSDPQPLELLSADRSGASAVGGGGDGDVIAYGIGSGFGPSAVRFVALDPAAPGGLAFLGDVDVSATGAPDRIAIRGDVAAVTGLNVVVLIDLTSPSLPARAVSVPSPVTGMALFPGWLATTSTASVTLVDLAPGGETRTWPCAAAPTAVLSTNASRFWIFTGGGYLELDLSSLPAAGTTLAPVPSATMRGVVAGYVGADMAVAVSPGSTPGTTRVQRLDGTPGASPQALETLELPWVYSGFAWDGAGRGVLSVNDPTDPYANFSREGWLITDAGGRLSASGLPLPDYQARQQTLAARSGQLFILDQSASLLRFQLR
jgi:hypothetical protein